MEDTDETRRGNLVAKGAVKKMKCEKKTPFSTTSGKALVTFDKICNATMPVQLRMGKHI